MSSRTQDNSSGEAEDLKGVGKECEIYKKRFSPSEHEAREVTWRILCKTFFQRYVGLEDTVVDIGAGDGHFISNINAARRVAVDLSGHTEALRQRNIEVVIAPAHEFTRYFRDKADVVFMSNFLEHLPRKDLVLQVFDQCRNCLKPGGRLLILQPNIRYVGPAYWDYIDHHIALTEHSLVEALDVSGFEVTEIIERFLPYTSKSALGRCVGRGPSWLVVLYLKCPWVWRFFGQQTFVVARVR